MARYLLYIKSGITMKTIFTFIFAFCVSMLFAQEMHNSEAEFLKQYEIDIKQTHLDGVYIPANLDEAYEDLLKLSDNEAIEKFAAADIEKIAPKLHFGIGRWMAVNWKFYTGSRLSHQLKGKGLLAPDAMIQFMLRGFHSYVNKTAFDEKKAITIANDLHEMKTKKSMEGDKVLKQETRKIPRSGN